MQVQPPLYYAIKKESDLLYISKQDTKPFPKQSAYRILTSLHEYFVKKNLTICRIEKHSDIKRMANIIFKGYEQKMGSWGLFWDNVKQFFGIKTERKQLMSLRDEIIHHVFASQFSKSGIVHFCESLPEFEKEVQSKIGSFGSITPSLNQIQSEIEEIKNADLETSFKVITHLAQYFNSLYFEVDSRNPEESKWSNPRSLAKRIYSYAIPTYSHCARIGKHYFKLDQLDKSFQVYQLIVLKGDDPKQIKGYLALFDKYFEKNRQDQAYEVAKKLAETALDQATEPLTKIGNHYLGLSQLDKAYEAYKLIRKGDQNQIEGYLALIGKYLEKNQTDQAYAVAKKLAKITLAVKSLVMIRRQYLSKQDTTQAQEVEKKINDIKQYNPEWQKSESQAI